MRCKDLATCFPLHHQLLTVALLLQHRRSGSSSSGRRHTITKPTVLLDMDHTILRALPSSSSSSSYSSSSSDQGNVAATLEEEVMTIMGGNTPQGRTTTTSATAVATTEEEFTVLRHVPWVSSGEWYRSLETESNKNTPQSVREGHNNNNAETTDPRTTTGAAPAHATNHNEVTAAGVVFLTIKMTPPLPLVTSRLRRMDIVLRPHLLLFLDELEGNWSVTEWRLCTANHPFNAMMVLFRIQQLLFQRKAAGLCCRRNNMTTRESNSIRDWILQRLSFASYACQSCRRDTCQCGAEEDRPGAMLMAPRKAHNHLFIPTHVDYVTKTKRQPTPASNPANVNGADLSPSSSSSCTAGADSSLIQWQLRDASFTNAILFDDTCRVFDAKDALESRKCIPVRRFGDRMQRVSPKHLVEGNNANAPTDCRPPSPSPDDDEQCRRVEGASVDDMTDSLFSPCAPPALSSSMEGAPLLDFGCECHDDENEKDMGIASRLVRQWRRLLLLEEDGQCLQSAPIMARAQYDALWAEACADFGDALDELQQQK
ncbi:Hypothetical protein, putative [Bodo saltans]|uniref:Uncharacterized protein n=1 Tax=Bodo saltans TaxID=75058 RepID=A0A0S4JUA5_BODSA|nr:Hypothetical protein, putative [Bodo saltans]|eukprot:CUG93871.1 Hypothetical protein, putative [Bodo saltans]